MSMSNSLNRQAREGRQEPIFKTFALFAFLAVKNFTVTESNHA